MDGVWTESVLNRELTRNSGFQVNELLRVDPQTDAHLVEEVKVFFLLFLGVDPVEFGLNAQ